MQHFYNLRKVARRTLWGALSTFILLLAGMREARASHYAAADIDVKFIGPQPQQGFCGAFQTEYRYVVRLRIYKACEQNSSPLGTSESYSISSTCNPTPLNRPMTVKPENIDTLDQLCAQYKSINSCRIPGQAGTTQNPYPYPAFVRHTYYDTVTLPNACADWTFFWAGFARNQAIGNLLSPDSRSLYVSALINNIAKPTNSTPILNTVPIPFICVDKPSLFLNGPSDIDGDSISVVTTFAKDAGGVAIPYQPPFTAANPVNSTAIPYAVNSRTGTASFQGPAQGKYVLAFRANEYDENGVLVGYVERDVQVAVLPCQVSAPDIDPAPSNITGGNVLSTGANNNLVTICPGSELKFNIAGTSQSAGAVLILTSNLTESAPTATLNVTNQGTDNLNGEFTWTPSRADVGPHTLIFTLTDSSCNASGQSILQRSYTVVSIIVPGDINAGPDGFYCPNPNGPAYQIKGFSPTQTTYNWSTVPGGSSTATLSCIDCLEPEARPDFPTEYIIEAAPTPYLCKLRDTVLVNTNNVKITQGPEVVLCRPTTLALNATATGLSPRQIIGCGTSDVAVCASPDSATIGNCTNSSTAANITPFYTYYATQKTQMLYRRNELRTAGVLPQTIKRIAFFVDATNSATPLNNLSIAMKCTPREQLTIVGTQSFETGTTTVYTGPGAVTLVQGWNYFTLNQDFNYDTTQNLLVDLCFSNPTSSYQTSASIQYSPTPYVSVISKNYFSGNVCNASATSYTPTTTPNRPNLRFFGCLPADKPFIYKWTPGDFLVDSFGANTSAYVPQSIKYYVSAEGIEGCIVRDSINIIVPTDTITVSPMDSLICPGELAIIQATQSPYENYQWYEGDFQPATSLDCDTCARVLARPKVDTRYTVVGTITYGNIRQVCPDTSVADVRVRMPAVIEVNPRDTTIKSGQRVILTATGGERYTWTPVSAGLNTNTGPRVLAQPQESTTYIVEGLDTNGCRGNDTADVRIDYRQTLFVPTAFTPNGDGNNDLFGVVNMSVQKIIEFRVFNRWGQEIFSTTDSRQGWDGTWKGVPQQTGSYNYIIRVSYPDGITDTFKGSVTLIR